MPDEGLTYPADALRAAGEETAEWIRKTTELRAVIRELCELAWEGSDIDGGDFEGLLERHLMLVKVPSDYNTMMEYESSTMLGLAWEVVNEHEKHFDGHVYTGDCIWCGVRGDMHDTPTCIDRLKTETYQELLDEGGVWDHIESEWHIPDEADSDG